MYFANFPNIFYANKWNTDPKYVVDITRRVKLRELIAKTSWLFEVYVIQDGERPDVVASKYYGDANLHWLVMIANDKFDISNDWPLSHRELELSLLNKYGSDYAIQQPHHYVDERGIIVHPQYAGFKTPISIYQYENDLNDTKRVIKLITPDLVPGIVAQFEEAIA